MAGVPDEELVAQVAAATIVRAAAAQVRAPEPLHAFVAERASDAIPARAAGGSTGMPALPIAARRAAAPPWWLAASGLGALATLAVGAVHLQQYFKLYSAVPTIGTLFALNFVGATVIGVALLAPLERLAGPVAVVLLAVSAIGLAATSFVFLLISEHTSLFGFTEPGYDPAGIAAARAVAALPDDQRRALVLAMYAGRSARGHCATSPSAPNADARSRSSRRSATSC
jgi:hypothetical protein